MGSTRAQQWPFFRNFRCELCEAPFYEIIGLQKVVIGCVNFAGFRWTKHYFRNWHLINCLRVQQASCCMTVQCACGKGIANQWDMLLYVIMLCSIVYNLNFKEVTSYLLTSRFQRPSAGWSLTPWHAATGLPWFFIPVGGNWWATFAQQMRPKWYPNSLFERYWK